MKIAQKLAQIISNIRQPERSGYHSYQDYEYSTRDDLFRVIRCELANHGIAIIPSVECTSLEPAGETSKGKPQVRAQVRLTVRLIDGESGEEMESTWDGEAVTTEDKGIQQAATQAVRFWCVNTFLLMDGSDEQMYGKSGASGGQTTNVHRQQSSYTDPLDAMYQKLRSAGFSDDQISTWLDGYVADIEGAEMIGEVLESRLHAWADKVCSATDEQVRAKVMDALSDDAA